MISMLPIQKEIRALANPEKAKILQGFFKTGKGEYGEGDVFLGLSVGDSRKIAKEHSTLPLKEVEQLLNSEVHEDRLVALLVLVHKFEDGSEEGRKEIFDFYLAHADRANNWDLVDLSADKIVGRHLLEKEKSPLYRLVREGNLWKKRIAIVATFAFIKEGRVDETFKIAKLLLGEKHDLLHKAVGWMLREAGKRDLASLERFIRENYTAMPRTTLRYAIERFSEPKRKKWLKAKF